MKKIKNLVIGGIQQKVFNLVLFTIILVMAAYTVVIVYQVNALSTLTEETNRMQKAAISTTSQETMTEVIHSSLGTSTQMEAMIADNLFQGPVSAVTMLRDYAEILFADESAYSPQPVSLPDASKNGEVTIQMLGEEGIDFSDPEIAEKTGLLGNMSGLMKTLYDNVDINACYIALPNGVMLLADDRSASKYDEQGTLIPISIREREWYIGAVETGRLYFTDVISDVFTGQIGVMCSLPVYVDGEIAAVVGADLFLDIMSDAVETTERNGGFVCVINQLGHVVFSPMTEGSLQVKLSDEAEDLRKSDNTALASFVESALRESTRVQQVEIDGQEYYISGAPVETVGWAILSLVSKAVVDQPTLLMESQYDSILSGALDTYNNNLTRAKRTVVALLLVIMAAAITAALIISKRIVKPLGAMTKRVASLGGNDLQFYMEDAFRTGDEIEVLAESFADLSGKTIQYMDQIRNVTAEKERISAELNMATAIQASQLPRLFPAFPNRPEFDIYASMTPAKEVGGDFYDFFLVDDDHICFVMADVSGKGVPAALFMMVSRVLIKSHIQNGESPSQALFNVNNQLCEGNDAGFFVTVWLAVLEISTGKGVAANAGHEHPALRRANGKYELVTYRHSMAVATMEEIPFKEHSFELHPGDSLFVYTDGVAEATNGQDELFGAERMIDALNVNPDASPVETLSNVMASIDKFVDGAQQFDDITMLCVKYIGPQS